MKTMWAKVVKQGKFVNLTMSSGADGPAHHIYRFDAEEESKAQVIALNINEALKLGPNRQE
jgi:hypothetical protein